LSMNRHRSDYRAYVRQIGGVRRAGAFCRFGASVALCVLVCAPTVWSQDKAPPPLPEDMVAAWEKAGAEPGWVVRDDEGYLRTYYGGSAWKPGHLRSVWFHDWKLGVLAKLPLPAYPFGISLHGTQVDDAGLKDLAGIMHLEALDLWQTKITD